jgi:ABC-2 type transport system ATP-binding protein
VREIIGLCGLEEAADRTLGRLSKGYRQRAGFSLALCGAPPVLVLDEPTVGLDPRQVAEIRELMRRLGEKHTIIFSSHLLSEVQQLCSRVVILHHGRVLREANLGDMMEDGGTLRLRVSIALGESRLRTETAAVVAATAVYLSYCQ